VFAESGRWYVVADDGRSQERRTFRIDRIEQAVPTGNRVPTEDYVTAPSGFFIDADVPRAVLRLAPEARWITEEYPVDDVVDLDALDVDVAERAPSGWVEVRLPIASERWLHRLLIRLGPNAVLVESDPAADRSAHGAAVLAQEILDRYS
jgi:proteasome accessory factor C